MADAPREQLVRQRALEIWERKGRKEGGELDDWEQAEREIEQELHSDILPGRGKTDDELAETAQDVEEEYEERRSAPPFPSV